MSTPSGAATAYSAFSSDDPLVLAEWDGLWATQKAAAAACRQAERDFAKQYGVESAELVVRTGFGDDVPVGFRWYRSQKPEEWIWWKRGSVICPRADKRGDAWRAQFKEVRCLYPRPRARLKKAFGVPEFVGMGRAPGLSRVGDEVWIYFGEDGTTEWLGGHYFRPRPLSEFFAAKEAAASKEEAT